MAQNDYKFEIPVNTKSIIKVIGVGGGGSNAVNYMYNKGIKGVEFLVCNTDIQALNLSPVPQKLQIGENLTSGLGAGANPDRGREAALENKNEIREILGNDTRMLFITAGMGGGTGTGAAPVISSIAKELGILTVAIVTSPFSFEGKKKIRQAEIGIEQLKKNCDTVLIISNDRLSEIYGNMKISEAFSQADNVLATAAKGIAEIITVETYVNMDFEDVKTVMRNSGSAVMGSAKAEGENRAVRAAQEALNSPLLDNRNIRGAQKILLSVMSGEKDELQMDELTAITNYIQEEAGEGAEVIFGTGIDPSLTDAIRVTVVVTGFDMQQKIKTTPPTVEEKTPVIENTYKAENENIVKEENRSFTFEVEKKEDTNQNSLIEEQEYFATKNVQPIKIIHNLEDDSEAQEITEDTNNNQENNTQHQQKSELELKIEKLSQEADERINKLKKLSNKTFENDSNKEKFEVPAYLRRNLDLGNSENS
ncbi:MAG: cell division protein FtsZ [Cytophagales bacterium]|nr:MAG: cell division protein FtsZ [Cytophagales bacterium]